MFGKIKSQPNNNMDSMQSNLERIRRIFETQKPQKILCVCLGNTCRSPMFAELLKKTLSYQAMVESAGVVALDGAGASSEAVIAMQEKNFDISRHKSRNIKELDLDKYDLIIGLDNLVNLPKVPKDKLVIINFEDPKNGKNTKIFT
ncbi:MAG: hypothetical protein NT091_02620 [Candidatus Falkowbacteria bacterium]|nr:hypothetical protein [Candidatus Falkowbacteria bacterium]